MLWLYKDTTCLWFCGCQVRWGLGTRTGCTRDLVFLPVVGTYVFYRPSPIGHRHSPTEKETCGLTAGDLGRDTGSVGGEMWWCCGVVS